MSRLMIALFVSAGLGFALPAAAQATSPGAVPSAMSKDALTQARTNADAQHKIDKDACSSLSGNAKDICLAGANGNSNAAKADAEAAYENTPKARENARVAHAQANYNVAVEKCDDLAGNRKDVCVKEAKANLVKGKSEAKVDRVTADTRNDTATKRSEARSEASADVRDADYKVAIEKCDALAGATKESCVSGAKVQFGKS
jgi:hypothetical protein